MVILLFGQPASGKTTLADKMMRYMPKLTVRIDGDVWRDITQNKDYSDEGRRNNLKSACQMAKLLDMQGHVVLMSFVFPFEELRKYLMENTHFIQVFLSYEGDRGRNNYFVKNFEEPTEGDCLRLSTSDFSTEDCISIILKYIKDKTGYDSGME